MALTPRDRRAVIILGAVAVVGIAYLLLTRGGGAPSEPVTRPTAPTIVPPPVTPSPSPAEERPPTFAFLGGRNPFVPLVVAEGGAGGQGTTGPSPSPSPSPTPMEGEQLGDHTVALIDIFTRNGEPMAQVEVDGTTYVVSEGDRFADNFRLVDIRGGCADFLFGDEPFTLCEPGERK